MIRPMALMIPMVLMSGCSITVTTTDIVTVNVINSTVEVGTFKKLAIDKPDEICYSNIIKEE